MENTEDYFSLKWSNFRSSLTKGFHDFLQEETMVDVTLAAEGKIVQAHKLVLSICSPYFKNLFKINPCTHPIVILKDVGHNDLSYMLEFMYKGEVGIKNEDLPSFLKLADTLKVRGLAGEKIQINENSSAKSLDSNVVRVRKKVNRESLSEVCKENNQSVVTDEQLEKKVVKNKKRRLSCRSESVKKLKSEKCASSSVSKCENKSDNISEDEDNNPLIKLIEGDNVKNSEGSKQSESLCDNENESQGDNKLSFSVWSDGALDSDDSGGPDINSFLQSVQSDDAEQAPQASALPLVTNPFPIESPQSSNSVDDLPVPFPEPANQENIEHLTEVLNQRFQEQWFSRRRCALCSQSKPTGKCGPFVNFSSKVKPFRKLASDELSLQPKRPKNVRTSLIWTYFIKYPQSATCRLCGRNFKGFRPHTSIECHLKNRHHNQYLDFMRNREEQRKKLVRDQFGHLFSEFCRMTDNFNI